MKTIFVILFSSFPHGSASASSLTSITAWKTCLKGWFFTARIPFILKIVPKPNVVQTVAKHVFDMCCKCFGLRTLDSLDESISVCLTNKHHEVSEELKEQNTIQHSD